MVWLNAANENGSGLYLNIHRIEERAQSLFAVHGTLGDGYYEGEVLIEIGTTAEVTFADVWLDRDALDDFFRRMDRIDVESALIETTSELLFHDFFSPWTHPGREGKKSQSEGRKKQSRVSNPGRGNILNAA